MRRKNHVLNEQLDKSTISVTTDTRYPGSVFLHINGGSFSYCGLFGPNTARQMGMGFISAMTDAEIAIADDAGEAVEARLAEVVEG